MANLIDQPESSGGFFAKIGRLLASPWVAPFAVVIALLLTAHAANNGLEADDYYHRAVLAGSERFGESLRGPQSMFRFLPGEREHAQHLMDEGFLPWWTDTKIKAEFLQLIPTQTHILDYKLWPKSPSMMHVQSLLWFALLVFLAAKFYRRILGATWMAGAAALLFAIEDGHGVPIGWICNRNILIAASFGIGSLIAHDMWRREGRRWAGILAVVLWTLCLLSKEAGIATSAYLFAYALWIDKGTLTQRFLTLVPYGIVLVVWRVVRDLLGYGVAHLGFYVDPLTDTGQFLTALVERYPVYLLGQWGIPSDLSVLIAPLLGSPFWWIAVGYSCLLALLFWPLVRRDRLSRFFVTGMLLSVIPICATFPNDRLLMFVGLGAMGLLVRFWYATFAADGPRPKLALWRIVAVPVAVIFILLHVVLAPPMLYMRANGMKFMDPLYIRTAFDALIEQQDLVVVNSPITMLAGYSLLQYEYEDMPSPRALRILAPGYNPMVVRRIDERTLEIEPETGYLHFLDQLFRNRQNPLALGEEVRIARMTAKVLTIEDGRPKNVAFRFDAPLEDAALRWLRFHKGEYIEWSPPAVGEEVILRTDWQPDFGL